MRSYRAKAVSHVCKLRAEYYAKENEVEHQLLRPAGSRGRVARCAADRIPKRRHGQDRGSKCRRLTLLSEWQGRESDPGIIDILAVAGGLNDVAPLEFSKVLCHFIGVHVKDCRNLGAGAGATMQ